MDTLLQLDGLNSNKVKYFQKSLKYGIATFGISSCFAFGAYVAKNIVSSDVIPPILNSISDKSLITIAIVTTTIASIGLLVLLKQHMKNIDNNKGLKFQEQTTLEREITEKLVDNKKKLSLLLLGYKVKDTKLVQCLMNGNKNLSRENELLMLYNMKKKSFEELEKMHQDVFLLGSKIEGQAELLKNLQDGTRHRKHLPKSAARMGKLTTVTKAKKNDFLQDRNILNGKQLSGKQANSNKIEVVIGFEYEGLKKTAHFNQAIEQMDSMSALIPFFNMSGAYGKRQNSNIIVDEYLPTLSHALGIINWRSVKSQMTVLFKIFSQTWDDHQGNMGADLEKNLYQFDKDLNLTENNLYVDCFGERTSALGHNYLQTLDPEVSLDIFEEFLEDAERALKAQFPGKKAFLNDKNEDALLALLQIRYAHRDDLSIHGSRNELFNPPKGAMEINEKNRSEAPSLRTVKKDFKNVIREDKEFWVTLKRILPKEKYIFFKRHPGHLHPEHLSLRQLTALQNRTRAMKGFLALKKEFGSANFVERKELLNKYLNFLPLTVADKFKILHALKINDDTDLRTHFEQLETILGKTLQWNDIACAAYPTLKRAQGWARNNSHKNVSHALSYDQSGVRKTLDEEIKQYQAFWNEFEVWRSSN